MVAWLSVVHTAFCHVVSRAFAVLAHPGLVIDDIQLVAIRRVVVVVVELGCALPLGVGWVVLQLWSL